MLLSIIYDIGAKLTTLGIHRLKADPTVQEMSPRTVPVRHQRNPHSMKGCADTWN